MEGNIMRIIMLLHVLLIYPISSQNLTCEKCCMGGAVSGEADSDRDSGYIVNYFKCLQIPDATTHVALTILNLTIGDDIITDVDDCINIREDTSKNHFEIWNGKEYIILCAGVNLANPIYRKYEIVSPENTLLFNLTFGRTESDIIPHYKLLYNVTACSDVTGGVITRYKNVFNISCTEGRVGVDSDIFHNCVDGQWELNGKIVTPNCTEPETERQPTTTKSSVISDVSCEYKADQKWQTKLEQLQEELNSMRIGLGVLGAAVFIGVIVIITLRICHHYGKLPCSRREIKESNTALELTDADKREPAHVGLLAQSDPHDDEITAAPQHATDVTIPPPEPNFPRQKDHSLQDGGQQTKKRCIIL